MASEQAQQAVETAKGGSYLYATSLAEDARYILSETEGWESERRAMAIAEYAHLCSIEERKKGGKKGIK